MPLPRASRSDGGVARQTSIRNECRTPEGETMPSFTTQHCWLLPDDDPAVVRQIVLAAMWIEVEARHARRFA